MPVQKVRTFLWFDSQAVEAANFYVTLFPNSKVTSVTPGPDGKPLVVAFELAGAEYLALNGGPVYQLSEAVSLSVDCEDQAEVDRLWDALLAGSGGGHCGWLKDRFGLSWQIVPSILPKLISDPARGGQVMQALLKMSKLNIAELQAAHDGAQP